jgi:hypothetical protein
LTGLRRAAKARAAFTVSATNINGARTVLAKATIRGATGELGSGGSRSVRTHSWREDGGAGGDHQGSAGALKRGAEGLHGALIGPASILVLREVVVVRGMNHAV